MFSEHVLAVLAPGQGSQSPGMLAPWLEVDGARQQVERWSEATGLDLVRLGTTAEAKEIKDTSVTQPLIVTLSLLAFEQLRHRVRLPESMPVAGHSVGELAAAAVAGALSTDDAVTLAARRGAEMAAACALEPTGMAAVLGGDADEVLARLTELRLDPANRNGASQVVAAGTREAIERLVKDPPANARVKPLEVAGAFHTHFMTPAEKALREHAKDIPVSDPTRQLLSNADGELVTSGNTLLERLVAQVTLPVRWDACMVKLGRLGTTVAVELPPAGALTGLVKRELKGTTTVALKTPDDLDKVADALAKQGEAR